VEKFFNLNFARTVLSWAAIAMTVVPTVTGCVFNALGALDCSGSWLPTQWQIPLVAGCMIINQVLKAIDTGFTHPTAAISDSGKPNTVSPALVKK
jgi:hypothetical protein